MRRVEGSGTRRAAVAVAKTPLLLYQRSISPALPRRCKYEPTCSRYALHALEEYGILRGAVLAVWRLLRCNPWSHGGYDPVQAQRLFKTGSHPRRSCSHETPVGTGR